MSIIEALQEGMRNKRTNGDLICPSKRFSDFTYPFCAILPEPEQHYSFFTYYSAQMESDILRIFIRKENIVSI